MIQKKTTVIAAFPGTGKTTAVKNKVFGDDCSYSDSDSSAFSWILDGDGKQTSERNPDFPQNYVDHIRSQIGTVDFVFVSTHAAVRQALAEASIDYMLVIPGKEDYDVYIQNYKDRLSPDAFIGVMQQNFVAWIDDCLADAYPKTVVLRPGKYISDIGSDIAAYRSQDRAINLVPAMETMMKHSTDMAAAITAAITNDGVHIGKHGSSVKIGGALIKSCEEARISGQSIKAHLRDDKEVRRDKLCQMPVFITVAALRNGNHEFHYHGLDTNEVVFMLEWLKNRAVNNLI